MKSPITSEGQSSKKNRKDVCPYPSYMYVHSFSLKAPIHNRVSWIASFHSIHSISWLNFDKSLLALHKQGAKFFSNYFLQVYSFATVFITPCET